MTTQRFIVLALLSTFLFFSFINAQSIDAKLGGNTDVVNFDVNDSDDTVLLRVQGDGKVGVGKTDPDSLLDVAGTTKTEGFMLPTGASDGFVLTSDVSGNASWKAVLGLGVVQWSPDGTYLAVGGGNVGIGTSTPDSLLDVDGTIKVKGFMMPTGAKDGAKLVSDAEGNASWVQEIIIEEIEVELWDSTDTHIFNKNTGNVGIGTETPDSLLEVAGTIKTLGLMMPSGAGEDFVLKSDADGNARWDVLEEHVIPNTVDSWPHWDSTATGSHIFNLNTGFVGIGTTTPTQKFDVIGDVKADYFRGDGSLLTNIVHPIQSPIWSISQSNPHSIYYCAGNVGICTTDPQYKLEVNGTVKANYFVGDGSMLTNLPSSGPAGELALPYADTTNSSDWAFAIYNEGGPSGYFESKTGNGIDARSSSATTSAGSIGNYNISNSYWALDVYSTGNNSQALLARTDGSLGNIAEFMNNLETKVTIDKTGKITANMFAGDGSMLTNIPNSHDPSSWWSLGTIPNSIYRPIGNVGIGTNSPNSLLSVGGPGEETGAPAIHAETATGYYGIFGGSSYTDGIGVYGSGRFAGVWGVGNDIGGLFEGDNGTTGIGVKAEGREYDFYADGAGTDYGSSSSIRWKRNIAQIQNPLEKIKSLDGVFFDWDAEHGGQHDIGMIAEDVGKVLPEIVQYEMNGVDAKGMDYSRLTPLLVEAVKELLNIVEKQALQISELEAK